MNQREVLRRLQAFHKGRPLPRGELLSFRIAADRDLLMVAFVRMGGESLPWGIAWGHPNRRPTVETVVDPRKRDAVAAMVVRFGRALLAHLGTPGFSRQAPPAALRQVWLPNPTHLEMLHHLNYAYTFTRAGGADTAVLNAVGRACGWLFREATRPGSQHVVVATEALRSAFTFPADDLRQSHLGFLLAWFDPGDRDTRRRAALEAERLPMATSLDPELERRELEPRLDAWQRPGGDARAALEIRRVIAEELRRRINLLAETVARLRADHRRENPGVERLVEAARSVQEGEYLRTERRLLGLEDGRPFVPSAETDRSPLAAARRYLEHEAAEALRVEALIHHDREMFAEAVADGEALEGTVREVRDEGRGRRSRPVWTLACKPAPGLRLRAGSWVAVRGAPWRTGVIRDIEEDRGGLVVEVAVTGGTRARDGAPAANDARLVGRTVELCPHSSYEITKRKIDKLFDRGPGSWLTHARPGGPLARAGPGDREPGEAEPA